MNRILSLLLLLVTACSRASAPSAPQPLSPLAGVAASSPFSVEVVGQGPPVVLIPGLTCGGHVWDATVEHLRPHHTVHVVTLAGFAGLPSASDGPFLAPVRDALAEYVHQLDEPVVIGHSLGGFMALWLASTEPDALSGAIAVDGLPSLGALSGQGPEAIAVFAEQMRAQMAGLSQEAFAAQTRQTLQVQISDPDEAARIAEVSARSDPPTVGRAMAELLTTDLRSEVGHATKPVLLLGAGGGSDAEVAAREAQYREQVATIPKHEVVMLPGTRHFVMLDAPESFFDQVDRFLDVAQ